MSRRDETQPRACLPPGFIVAALQEPLAALWSALDGQHIARSFRQRLGDGRHVAIAGKAVHTRDCPEVWLMHDGSSYWLSGIEFTDQRIARCWLPGELEPGDPGGWDDDVVDESGPWATSGPTG